MILTEPAGEETAAAFKIGIRVLVTIKCPRTDLEVQEKGVIVGEAAAKNWSKSLEPFVPYWRSYPSTVF